MFVGVPSSGKTILTWTGNKRDILGQLILTSLSSSVKFIHICLLFPKNTVNIEGGSLFNFTHLWNNHPYHEAQGLVRKRGGGIGQSLEQWQHQYPIVNPIQSNGRVRDVFLAMERVWSKHSLVLQSFAQHRRLLGCHSGLHGWLQSNHRISLTLIFAEAVIETLFFFANFCQ